MSDLNTAHNRAVWFDIPAVDLDRAGAFYRAVLGVKVEKSEFEGFSFCVIEHDQGNGGCLVPAADEISSTGGILVYMNERGRAHSRRGTKGRCNGREDRRADQSHRSTRVSRRCARQRRQSHRPAFVGRWLIACQPMAKPLTKSLCSLQRLV